MVYIGGDYIYSADGGTSWTTITDYDLWFEEYGDAYSEAASGEPIVAPPREFYISGYLPRYQKRQLVGYHAASGDLRSVEVNASGHLFSDIEIVVSSGLIVNISGQHVHLESGDAIDVLEYGYHVLSGEWRPKAVCDSGEIVVCSGLYVVADIAESGIGVQVQSGAHVMISGQHVYVESGVHVLVSGQQTARSGHGAQYPYHTEIDDGAIAKTGYYETNINLLYAWESDHDEWERVLMEDGFIVVQNRSGAHVQISGQHVYVESGVWLADTSGTTQNVLLHGYHPASGIWVPLAVTLSGCLAMTYCSSGGLF